MHKLRPRTSLAGLRPPIRHFASHGPAEAQLFVRNLPSGAEADDVRGAFEAVCTVRGVAIPKDHATGQSRGFAFVTIEAADYDAVRREMDGALMGGRKIAVRLATASSTAPARSTSQSQRPGGMAAAIALNKQLISSETAADVLSLFKNKGGDFNYVNFATSLHRLGVLSRSFDTSSRPLLHKLVERAVSSIMNESNKWESRGLANACWGIAKIGNVEAPALFEAVAAESPKKIETFKSQELANIVWAYAAAEVEAPALFGAVAAEAPKKIETFNPQALVNTVWAYATAGVEAPALFEAVAAESSKRIATFNQQDLANTVWAYATAGVEAPALFDAVAAEAPKKIAAFNSQALANTLWAYAAVGVYAPALFEAVAAVSSKKIATFKPQELTNTVWAYATAGIEAPALFEAVAAESSKKIATFNPHDLANTVWAYATAGVEALALFEVIALRIEPKISEFSPDALSQLHQVYVHLRLEAPHHALTLLLSRHEPVFCAAYIRQELSPSRTQGDVSTALSSIGWAHEFEYVTAEGISLDMADPALKVAVEFDGPKHYLVGSSDGVPTRVLDGKSKFKTRLLRRLGWKLVRVPYFEWQTRSSAEREAYLRDGMADAFGSSRDAAVQSADGGDASASAGEAASRECGEAAYSRMTVKDLKALLKERGLKQAGLKKELIQRFEEDDERRRNAV